MKKITLLILLVFSMPTVKAFSITDLTVSPISGTDNIKVNLRTIHGSVHYNATSSYTIMGNVITISACYSILTAWSVTYTNQNIVLTGINTGNTNYTLIVNLHGLITYSTEPPYVLECNYNIIKTTATLNFGTVLTNTVTLANDSFENNTTNFSLFPSPNNGSFSINAVENFNLEIYDILGKLVYTKKDIQNNTEIVTELKKGLYFVKIITPENKQITKKMIVE